MKLDEEEYQELYQLIQSVRYYHVTAPLREQVCAIADIYTQRSEVGYLQPPNVNQLSEIQAFVLYNTAFGQTMRRKASQHYEQLVQQRSTGHKYNRRMKPYYVINKELRDVKWSQHPEFGVTNSLTRLLYHMETVMRREKFPPHITAVAAICTLPMPEDGDWRDRAQLLRELLSVIHQHPNVASQLILRRREEQYNSFNYRKTFDFETTSYYQVIKGWKVEEKH